MKQCTSCKGTGQLPGPYGTQRHCDICEGRGWTISWLEVGAFAVVLCTLFALTVCTALVIPN
jgi:DnaJ-class molecular chaperone